MIKIEIIMKKFISYIMMVICSAVLSVSCNQEVIQDNSYGYLGVSIDSDLSEEVLTKAGTDELVFSLDVLNASGEKVEGRDDHRTITEEDPIKLQIGSYSVAAKSGQNLNAAFDNPYYEGKSGSFKINPNRTTSVSLTCTLANTIVSVEFPGDFSRFTDYEVAVTNGVGDKLVFSNKPAAGNRLEAALGAKAYFAVTGTITWELYLRNTDGGEYRATDTYTGVKAKQHYHLKFAMGEDETADGGFIIKVGLENSWDDSEHDILLDFSKKNMPSVSSNAEFSATSGESVPIPIGNTAEKELSFNAAEGIRSLRISHDNELLAEKGIPEVLELTEASASQMSALDAAGLVIKDVPVRSIDSGSKKVSVNLTGLISSLPVGSYGMDFVLVDTKGRYDVFELRVEVISDVDAEAVAVRTGWASFAQLEGRFFDLSKKNVLTFQYRKASDTEWIELDPSDMNVNTVSMSYSTMLFSLEPSVEYVFRAVSDEDKETKEIRFTTADAKTIHNLSFDHWYQDDKAWMPNESSSNYVWDTANPGTASLGYVPTSPETADVVKGKAARLETQEVSVVGIKKLAAGNIYTGKFGKVAGVGAELYWGIPFDSRPLALRGYMKYKSTTINKAQAPYSDKKNTPDVCQIQMFLTDWTETFKISTSDKKFVDFNDGAIIARGEMHTSDSHNGYVRFTIPLVYRDHRTPRYAVISAAASMYGDYFTGGVGSTLLLDEFELVYDPAELTEEEFNTVFSQVSPF